MKRTHLPLNALRVFDAAARHLSFTRAADELAVTPAAVGQQIRALEDVLGVVLFRRTSKGLEPQEAFAQGVEPGLGLVGQLEALGGAAEQHHAEHVLERADLLPDRRGGDRELVSRARERQVPRGGVEHAQGVEGQVRALHGAGAFKVAAGGWQWPEWLAPASPPRAAPHATAPGFPSSRGDRRSGA